MPRKKISLTERILRQYAGENLPVKFYEEIQYMAQLKKSDNRCPGIKIFSFRLQNILFSLIHHILSGVDSSPKLYGGGRCSPSRSCAESPRLISRWG